MRARSTALRFAVRHRRLVIAAILVSVQTSQSAIADDVITSQLRGRPTLIFRWASDCSPSLCAIPVVNVLHDGIGADGAVHIVGLTTDDDSSVRKVVQDLDVEWPVIQTPEASFEAEESRRTPFFWVFNGQKELAYSGDDVRAAEQALLAVHRKRVFPGVLRIRAWRTRSNSLPHPLPDLVLEWDAVRNRKRGVPFHKGEYSTQPVRIRISGGRFKPRVAHVRAGQSVEILADHAVEHGVRFDFIRNLQRGPSQRFEAPVVDRRLVSRPEPAPVRVTTAVDPRDSCWLAVTDHNLVGITGQTGRGRVEPLPIGPQYFRLWHPDVSAKEIRLQVNGTRWPVEKGRFLWDVQPGTNELELELSVE